MNRRGRYVSVTVSVGMGRGRAGGKEGRREGGGGILNSGIRRGEEGVSGRRGSAPLPVRPVSVSLPLCLTPTYLPTYLRIDRSASSRTRLGSPHSALRWVVNSCSRLARSLARSLVRSLTVRFARSPGHGEYAGRATRGAAGSEAEVFFEASGCKGGY